MRPTSTLASLLIVVGLAAGSPVSPLGIQPRTLWELAADSDLIAWARVVEVKEPEPTEPNPESDDWDLPDYVARLAILAVWKGRFHEPTLDVLFHGSLICPAPPRYVEGEKVLAFVERTEEGWRTVALSYGTLYPRSSELDLFRTLVQSAIDGQRLPKDQRRQARIEWAVEASMDAATRWHGLYELEFNGSGADSRDEHGNDPMMALSVSQKSRIAAGFVAEPRVDRTLPMVLAVLDGYRGSYEFDRVVVGALESALEMPNPGWTGEFTTGVDGQQEPVTSDDAMFPWTVDALVLAMEYFGDSEAAETVHGARGKAWSLSMAVGQELWRDAKRRLGIPAGRRVEAWVPESH